jgi:hypothetical protein
MSHYAPEVVLISPIASRLLGDSSGTVVGKEALLGYFRQGLQAYPNLAFRLIEVMWGISSIVIHYVNPKQYEMRRVHGTHTRWKGL